MTGEIGGVTGNSTHRRAMLGNMPQALSHLALIQAASAIAERG